MKPEGQSDDSVSAVQQLSVQSTFTALMFMMLYTLIKRYVFGISGSGKPERSRRAAAIPSC